MKVHSRKDGDAGQANHKYLNQRKDQQNQAEEEGNEEVVGSGVKVNVVA